MTSMTEVAPVMRTVTVAAPKDRAFEVFTSKMGEWWPTERHSIGEARVADVILEPIAGGRIYELWDDGTQKSWGRVVAWEPTDRVVLAWKPNDSDNPPTEVEVTFVPDGDGTRVELEHRGWERLGDLAEEARVSYASDGGWTFVLSRYADLSN